MARKSKCTEEVIAKVAEAVKLGATYELAARYAGIAESTFYEWMNTRSEFAEAVKSAEGTGAMLWLAKIERAASDGDWQAAAWKLERRYPELYGRRERVKHEVSGPDGDSLRIQVEFTAQVALAAIAARPTTDSGSVTDGGHRLLGDGETLG